MSDLPTPEDVEEAKQKSVMCALLTREHYESLLASGFKEDEALELAVNYHWALIGGNVQEGDV